MMKKGFMAAIAVVIVSGGIYGVNGTYAAQESTDVSTVIDEITISEGREKVKNRLGFMEEFQEELHSRNEAKIERLELHQQIIEKKDQLLDLTLAASKSDNKEMVSELKEVKKQIQAVNNDLKDLHKLIKVEKNEFNKLVKHEEIDLAHKQANQMLSLGEKVNEKLRDKVELLDELIAILNK